jgi:hypothetical protein
MLRPFCNEFSNRQTWSPWHLERSADASGQNPAVPLAASEPGEEMVRTVGLALPLGPVIFLNTVASPHCLFRQRQGPIVRSTLCRVSRARFCPLEAEPGQGLAIVMASHAAVVERR